MLPINIFCDNPKSKLAFQLMSMLGFRIGEVVRINIKDVYWKHNKIKVFSEKTHQTDYLYLHNKVRKLISDWVRKHHNSIEQNEGYLFYSFKECRKHISKDWLRKEFRRIRDNAGLNETYGVAEDINNPKRWNYGDRKLYRLTTHSLRHYYITKVYQSCRDPLLTMKNARHRDINSTKTYIHLSEAEVDDTLNKAFSEEKMNFGKQDVNELIELIKVWKESKS
jgi:integrase